MKTPFIYIYSAHAGAGCVVRESSSGAHSRRRTRTDRTTRLLIVILCLFLLAEFPQVHKFISSTSCSNFIPVPEKIHWLLIGNTWNLVWSSGRQLLPALLHPAWGADGYARPHKLHGQLSSLLCHVQTVQTNLPQGNYYHLTPWSKILQRIFILWICTATLNLNLLDSWAPLCYLSGLVWFYINWFGMDEFGLVWLSLVWYGWLWFGMDDFGLVWMTLVWCGWVRFGMD